MRRCYWVLPLLLLLVYIRARPKCPCLRGPPLSLRQVEIPSSGVSAYLCDVTENAALSRVTGTVGKRRLVAGPGTEPMALNGVTTAFGLCTPVPADGSSCLVYDLDPEMVREPAVCGAPPRVPYLLPFCASCSSSCSLPHLLLSHFNALCFAVALSLSSLHFCLSLSSWLRPVCC